MSELEFIYRVAFNEPPLENDDSWEFYFTSLSAIYEKFTPEQVGCKVSRLWNLKITPELRTERFFQVGSDGIPRHREGL